MTDRILILDFGSQVMQLIARLGGAVIAEGLDDGLPDVAYGWRDLNALIARCGPVSQA